MVAHTYTAIKGSIPYLKGRREGGKEVRNKVLPCMKYRVLIYAGLNVFVVKLSFVVVFFASFFAPRVLCIGI